MAVDVIFAPKQNGRFLGQNKIANFSRQNKNVRFSRQILKLVLQIFAFKPNM